MADGAPSSDPQGSPPSGNVSSTATCCPEVSTFDGSRNASRVWGFDARTNLVENRDSDEYWIPPDKGKSAPGDMMTQDGAAWVSVALGRTTELEIAFEGQSGNGCLVNCQFAPGSPAIVEVVTTSVASNNAAFQLRGLAEGETSIVVTCDGAEIGWVHVVCYPLIEVDAVVGSIVSPYTREVQYSASTLESVLNHTFAQACIKINVVDIGALDYTGNEPFQAAENLGVSNLDTPYPSDGYGDLTGNVMDPSANEMAFLEMAPPLLQGPIKARTGADICLLYYVSTDLPSRFNGSVPAVGSGPCFAYKDFTDATEPGYSIADSYAVLAHELGHAFNLNHPDRAGGDELPSHLSGSTGGAVVAEPATNTEPAIEPAGKPVGLPKNSVNIMARDPLNLMGYWPAFQEQVFIRKLQWDTCRAGALAILGG